MTNQRMPDARKAELRALAHSFAVMSDDRGLLAAGLDEALDALEAAERDLKRVLSNEAHAAEACGVAVRALAAAEARAEAAEARAAEADGDAKRWRDAAAAVDYEACYEAGDAVFRMFTGQAEQRAHVAYAAVAARARAEVEARLVAAEARAAEWERKARRVGCDGNEGCGCIACVTYEEKVL